MKRLFLALALGFALPVGGLTPAVAQSPADSLPFVQLRIGALSCPDCPTQACAGDSIPVLVRGEFRNDCFELRGIELVPPSPGTAPQPPKLRLIVSYNDFSSHCAIPTLKPFSAAVMLPPLPPGSFELQAEEVWDRLVRPDSIFSAAYPFVVGPCPPGVTPLPFVTRFEIGKPPCEGCPPQICPGESIRVTVAGVFPDRCRDFLGIELLPSPLGARYAPPIVRLVVRQRCDPCLPLPTPFEGSVMLPPLWLGNYRLLAEEAFLTCDGQLDTLWNSSIPFAVVDACTTSGRPPLVRTIEVGARPCASCPPEACPGDSVPVLITGEFPDDCWEFRGVEVLPSDASSPGPQPPRLRVELFRNDCIDRACARVVVPFAARLRLPPLPSGIYALEVEEHQTILCGVPPEASFRYAPGFRVADRCSTGTACFLTDWVHGPNACDAFVDRQHPGQVTLTALTNKVPLAGLQGSLSLYPAGLAITDLTPLGPAATWKVAWEPTTDGVGFVMFSTDGSVIPVADPRGAHDPVLRVTLAIAGAEPPPTLTHLRVSAIQASDPQGRDVRGCPILTLVVVEARICAGGQACDFNHDGVADIRDLVLMVHCILGNGSCPDTTTAALDCDLDGRKSLEDIFCCARAVLWGGTPIPVDGRSEPSVQVAFGVPSLTSGGLDVPVHIEGVDRLGAARLALSFPSNRFDVIGVDLPAGTSEWLDLHEVDGSDLAVGLLRIGAQEIARGSLDLTLHLSLKPGQEPGGEIRLASGEFSGPDGAALSVSFTPASLPAAAASRLSLSAAEPNPFSRETQFSVTMPRAGEVELAVHELTGRRIATVLRGHLEAGTRGFRWAGTDEAGRPVPNGIYFLRLRGPGDEVTRKVIVLRGE